MLRIPRPIGTLFFLLAWLMPWRPAYCIRAEHSKLSFFVHRRDLIGRHIAKYGSHEPVLTRWISDYLATSSQGLFVDIGANLGWYAVHAARHTAVKTVIAFEPDSVQRLAARSQSLAKWHRQRNREYLRCGRATRICPFVSL